MRREALALAVIAVLAGPAGAASVMDGPFQPLLAPARARWLALEHARAGFPGDVGMACAGWTTERSRGYYTMTRDFEAQPAARRLKLLEAVDAGPMSVIDRYGWRLLADKQDEAGSGYSMYEGRRDYEIRAFDGRLLSGTPAEASGWSGLTEAARFEYYSYLEHGPGLRNVGHPAWRHVRYPITAAHERAVRLAFWRFVKWPEHAWIAWVPEHGYFEIDLPRAGYHRGWLAAFLRRLPRPERALVLDMDGDMLEGPGALRFR